MGIRLKTQLAFDPGGANIRPAMTARRGRLVRLRAACAAVILLIGGLSAVASLAAGRSNVCSMTCCVGQRDCCCRSRRHFTGKPTSKSQTQVSRIKGPAPCPQQCAASSGFSRTLSNDPSGKVVHVVHVCISLFPGVGQTVQVTNQHHFSRSSPRAPPLSFVNRAI